LAVLALTPTEHRCIEDCQGQRQCYDYRKVVPYRFALISFESPLLIHNVGDSGAHGDGALALTDDDWQQAFDLNLFAAVRLDRSFIPSMVVHSGLYKLIERTKAFA
jgi:hypothetical protein